MFRRDRPGPRGPGLRGPDARCRAGLEDLRHGRLDEAVAVLDPPGGCGSDPVRRKAAAEARTVRGLALVHAGDLSRARGDLARAAGLWPAIPAAGEFLARIHHRRGDPGGALTALDGSASAPATIERELLRAVCLHQRGDTPAAHGALDRALALGVEWPLGVAARAVAAPLTDPSGAGVVLRYADQRCRLAVQLLASNPAAAADHLESALATNPGYLRARIALALVSLHLGRVPRALELLERARELEPAYPDVLAWLGLARLRAGDGAGAVRTLERAAGLRREFARARRFLALARHAMGESRAALEEARQGLVREHDVPIWLDRLRVPGLEAEAAGVADLCRALAVRPGCADLHLALGRGHAARGALHDARYAIGAALKLQPDYAAARLEMARLELAQGRLPEAEVLLAQVAAERPGWADAQALLGRSRLFLGRAREAVLPLRAALRRQPALAMARRDLGLALDALGPVARQRAMWPASMEGLPAPA